MGDLAHPFFEGIICRKCSDAYLEFVMTIDKFGENAYCIICASYRSCKLRVCEFKKCGRAFCELCLREYHVSGWDVAVNTTWLCLLCTEIDPDIHGDLKPKPDWKENLLRLLCPGKNPGFMTWYERPPWKVKCKRLRVVNLFCGIGLGLFTLKKLGYNIDKAFLYDPSDDMMDICRTNHPEATHFSTIQSALRLMDSGCRIDLLIIGPGWYRSEVPDWPWRNILKEIRRYLLTMSELHWLLFIDNTVHLDNKHLISTVLSCRPVSWNSGALGGAERLTYAWGSLPILYTFPDPQMVRNQLEVLSKPGPVESLNYVNGITQEKCTNATFGEARVSWLAFAVDVYRGRKTLPGSGVLQMIAELTKEKIKREQETGEPCLAVDPSVDGPDFYNKMLSWSAIPNYSKTILQMNTRLEELRKYEGNSIELERELGINLHYTDNKNFSSGIRIKILRSECITVQALSLILAPLKRDFSLKFSLQSPIMDYKQAQSKIY